MYQRLLGLGMHMNIVKLGPALEFSLVVARLQQAPQSPEGQYNRVLGPSLRSSDSIIPSGAPRIFVL